MTKIIRVGGYAEVRAKSREEVEKLMLEWAAEPIEILGSQTFMAWWNGPTGGDVDIFEYAPGKWRIFGWEVPIAKISESAMLEAFGQYRLGPFVLFLTGFGHAKPGSPYKLKQIAPDPKESVA